MKTIGVVRQLAFALFVTAALSDSARSADDYCYIETAEGEYISLNELCDPAESSPTVPRVDPSSLEPELSDEQLPSEAQVETTVETTIERTSTPNPTQPGQAEPEAVPAEPTVEPAAPASESDEPTSPPSSPFEDVPDPFEDAPDPFEEPAPAPAESPEVNGEMDSSTNSDMDMPASENVDLAPEAPELDSPR